MTGVPGVSSRGAEGNLVAYGTGAIGLQRGGQIYPSILQPAPLPACYTQKAEMLLDLSSFGRALASLDRAIVRAQAALTDEELRDAVIQRFEYTYELAWKMLKRHLEQVVPDPARIDGLSFRELIREGAERGIVSDVEAWFEYRHQRNLTSHAYNAAAAQIVFQTALRFREAAHLLYRELVVRNVE